MSISPFFLHLRSAYQAELDDLTFDSEGRDVLRQRLAERRKEVGFLLQMMELSPEMVAVVFHQGFRFKLPGAMEHLISHESDELPDWSSLVGAVQLAPWAQDVAQLILKEPQGEWFLAVAAGLEYMYGKLEAPAAASHDDNADDDEGEGGDTDRLDDYDADEEDEARAREDAGADWMVEQGFDRKD
ncbi:hypothetical protein [Rhodoferax sp.]|uniref:hypothetical protein n=1 Tax=Rhodoferax sp. TaxID=50421 RepID=UPI001EB2268B|nr:hypothetical protein [Rhodoferax sp.]MBT9506428.1 hypothetical protein [Rhodoferax sp.]